MYAKSPTFVFNLKNLALWILTKKNPISPKTGFTSSTSSGLKKQRTGVGFPLFSLVII